MKTLKLFLVIILTTFVSAGCKTAQDKSEKFVGVWKMIVKNEDGHSYDHMKDHPITISKSGVNFIVQVPDYGSWNGSYNGDKQLSGSFIKEQDKLEVSTEIGKVDIIINASQNLLFEDFEWQKIK